MSTSKPLATEKCGDRWIVYPLGRRDVILASGASCTEALQAASEKR